MGLGNVWAVVWGVIERSKFALFEVIIEEFKIWEKIILCVLGVNLVFHITVFNVNVHHFNITIWFAPSTPVNILVF